MPSASTDEFKTGANVISQCFTSFGRVSLLPEFKESLKLMVGRVMQESKEKRRTLCETIGRRMSRLDNQEQYDLTQYIEESNLTPELKKLIAAQINH